MESPPIQVYSYIRFSRLEQQKGDSLRRQSNLADTWIIRHPGHQLDQSLTLRDLGVSAFKGKNRKEGALAVFLQAIDTGRVPKGSVLLVENLDRLSRENIRNAKKLWESVLERGVKIATIEPDRLFTEASLDDPFAIMEALIYMKRANDESATKSKRCLAAWSNRKQKAIEKKQPLTKMCPAWLAVEGDKYRLIPGHAKTLRLIAKLAIDGMGMAQVARYLNEKKVEPVGKGPWRIGRIGKLLRNRQLIGEYQPHQGSSWHDRKPVGDPVPNFFPRVLTDDIWYRLQSALDSRKSQRGRVSKQVTNLFQGLLLGPDGGTYFYHYNSFSAHLKPAKHYSGLGGDRTTFPYVAFEKTLLRWLTEIKPEDIETHANPGKLGETVSETEGRIADLDHRIEKIQERLAIEPEIGALIDVVARLDSDRHKLKEQLAELHRQQTANDDTPHASCIAVIRMLETAKGDDLYRLRLKVKAKIRQLVEQIVMSIRWRDTQWRDCDVLVTFTSGIKRKITVMVRRGHPNMVWYLVDGKLGVLSWGQTTELSEKPGTENTSLPKPSQRPSKRPSR